MMAQVTAVERLESLLRDAEAGEIEWDLLLDRFQQIFEGLSAGMDDLEDAVALAPRVCAAIVQHPGCDFERVYVELYYQNYLINGFRVFGVNEFAESISKNPMAPVWLDSGNAQFIQYLEKACRGSYVRNMKEILYDARSDAGWKISHFSKILPNLKELGLSDDIEYYVNWQKVDGVAEGIVWVSDCIKTAGWMTIAAMSRMIASHFDLQDRRAKTPVDFLFESHG